MFSLSHLFFWRKKRLSFFPMNYEERKHWIPKRGQLVRIRTFEAIMADANEDIRRKGGHIFLDKNYGIIFFGGDCFTQKMGYLSGQTFLLDRDLPGKAKIFYKGYLFVRWYLEPAETKIYSKRALKAHYE